GDGRVNRVAEVSREGFVYLVDVVAVDDDGDRLRRSRIGGKSQSAALGDVVGGGGGGAVGGAVVHSNTLGTGGRNADRESGVDRRPGIDFGHRHIVYGNGRPVVVDDDRGDLLGAGLDAVGYGGNIHNDRFVHFVQKVLHRG